MDKDFVIYLNDQVQECRRALEEQYVGVSEKMTQDEVFDLKLTMALAIHNMKRLNDEISKRDEKKVSKFSPKSWYSREKP